MCSFHKPAELRLTWSPADQTSCVRPSGLHVTVEFSSVMCSFQPLRLVLCWLCSNGPNRVCFLLQSSQDCRGGSDKKNESTRAGTRSVRRGGGHGEGRRRSPRPPDGREKPRVFYCWCLSGFQGHLVELQSLSLLTSDPPGGRSLPLSWFSCFSPSECWATAKPPRWMPVYQKGNKVCVCVCVVVVGGGYFGLHFHPVRRRSYKSGCQ